VRVDGKLITSRGDTLLARMKPPRLPDVSDVIAAIEPQKFLPEAKSSVAARVRHQFTVQDAKHFYDWFGAWQDLQFYERKALECLIANSDFEHAMAVFELGCGTGRLAENLLRRYLTGNATYTGMDISTTMVRIARQRLANWSGRAKVQQCDGTAKLPYADHVFDRFVATYVLDLLPEPAICGVLREAHRVLRPNGKLCVVSSTKGITIVSRALSSFWKRIYAIDPRLVGGCRPLRLSALIDSASWIIKHAQVSCSWGICSEIIIGFPT
jgi:ubiquinone/menaquinone biosynthesis C-methylase UbiE